MAGGVETCMQWMRLSLPKALALVGVDLVEDFVVVEVLVVEALVGVAEVELVAVEQEAHGKLILLLKGFYYL